MNAGENRVPALVIADAVLMRLGSGPFRIALPSSPTTMLLQNPSGRMDSAASYFMGRESEVLRCSGTCANMGWDAEPGWGLPLAFMLYLLL